MKLPCPNCHRPIPSDDIELTAGWAKCRKCDEIFKLAEILPGYGTSVSAGPAALPERPFDAWAVVDRTPERLIIAVPPYGMRAASWGLLGFATFWLAFIAFWTAGALGVFFNHGRVRPQNAIFAAFSMPFWLVGIGMLAGVLWSARGTRRVYLDASTLYTESRCLSARWRKTIDRADVQHARQGVMKVRSNDNSSYTPYSVEIIYTKGSCRLPCNSEAEQEWLIGQINDFLRTVPYRPGPSDGREMLEMGN
jgi:hypothetical protein